jgi:hypothetical protein
MVIDPNTDEITFKSGRKAYAHGGTIGLSAPLVDECGKFYGGVSEGWDGGMDLKSWDDCIEVADYMIQLWTEYREKAIQAQRNNERI